MSRSHANITTDLHKQASTNPLYKYLVVMTSCIFLEDLTSNYTNSFSFITPDPALTHIHLWLLLKKDLLPILGVTVSDLEPACYPNFLEVLVPCGDEIKLPVCCGIIPLYV